MAALVSFVALASCTNSGVGDTAGFGSPERAAEAFAPEELGDFEPWDDRDGACRVLLVGDSLVEAALRAQTDAFTYVGCESIVDGLTARSLSDGWQCLGDRGRSMEIVLRAYPEPGNPTCRPSGLELLRQWDELTSAASATVIALGTNDAGMYTEEGFVRRWRRVVDMTSGPLVFVTVAARPGDRWVANAERYNASLRWWCPMEPRCVLAEWDLTAPARDPASYVDHVHLTRSAGEMRAVFIAAVTRRVAVAAPPGPSRWRAPSITMPLLPSSTTSGPVATGPSGPPPNTSPPTVLLPTTTLPSTQVTTSTTTTTTTIPLVPPPADP